MRVIALCCFGERSSYILAKKIKELDENKNLYVDSLKHICKHYDEVKLKEDIVLVYGSISIFNKYDIHKYHLENKLQCIWLCPQAQYRKDSIQEAFLPAHMEIYVVENTVFGRQDAKTLWNQMKLKI